MPFGTLRIARTLPAMYRNKTMRLIITITLFAITLNAFANNDSTDKKFTVEPTTLNVRDKPSANSNIIGKVFKDDTIRGIKENDSWTTIKFDGKTGYVSSKFINEVAEPGFITGFTDGFTSVFLNIALGIAAIIYYKSKRVKDGRYKSGYRELPFTTMELLKIALYSSILSTINGFFTGVVSWF